MINHVQVDKATSSIQEHDERLQLCAAAVDDFAHKVNSMTAQRVDSIDC